MTDTLTVIGFVATPPSVKTVAGDLAITSFRIASNQRRFDRARGKFIDASTNWYTVTAFRQLAVNVGASVVKGDRVVVSGRLRVRDWETADNKKGTSVEIEADAVGHDLAWGTTAFTRVFSAVTTSGEEHAADPTPEDVDSSLDAGDAESESTAAAASLWSAPGVDASESDDSSLRVDASGQPVPF